MQVEQDSAEASNFRFDNKVNGMTEDTAKRSIDWLLRTDVTDKLADGGISTLNIVVDAGTEPSPPSGMRLPMLAELLPTITSTSRPCSNRMNIPNTRTTMSLT